MTNREAISMVKGRVEDPSNLPQNAIAYPPKFIYHVLVMARDTVLYSDKSKSYNHHAGYMLRGIELKKVDFAEVPIAPPTGFYVMKTTYPLPKFKDFIYGVTSIKIDGPVFEYIDYREIKDLSVSRFSGLLENKYTLINSNGKTELYLIGKKIKYVSIHAPFSDLFEVVKYPCFLNKDKTDLYSFLDLNFDVPAEYLETVLSRATMYILDPQRLLAGPSDNQTNDSDDDKKRIKP